jgi:ELWxxDGT repeat protein
MRNGQRASPLVAVLVMMLAAPAVASATGASLVRDIFARPHSLSSSPNDFHRAGGWTVFIASTPGEGDELWRTDGTAAGTTLVKDLEPGPLGSDVRCMVERGGDVYFVAHIARMEDFPSELALWRSNGTPEGTVQLARVVGDRAFEAPCAIAATPDRVIFAAVHRQGDGFAIDLWRSNGTSSGTDRIARLTSLGRWDPSMLSVGRGVYFTVRSDAGTEIWKTDGTSGGTRMAERVADADGRVYPILLAGLDDRLLFALYSSDDTAMLWRSNGTAAGTAPVVERTFRFNEFAPRLVAADRLLLSTADGILATDGTSAGTRLAVEATIPIRFAPLGDAVLFFTGTPVSSTIWRWDDLDTAPTAVADAGAFAFEVAALDGQVLFAAWSSTGTEQVLWRTDGTASGTARITAPGLTNIDALTSVGGRAYLAGPGDDEPSELWASDGSGAGTHLVADIAADDQVTDSSAPAELVRVGDRLFFSATDGDHGRQLWASDGTRSGTALVRQIGDPLRANDIGDLTAFGGALFFATGRPHDAQFAALWRSDGTAAGTVVAQSRFGGAPYRLTVAGDALYFLLGDYGQVCRTGGSDANTTCGSGFRRVTEMVANGDRVVLSADPYTEGEEPWLSDGTVAGTRLIRDLATAPGRGSEPRFLSTVGDRTYFVTVDDNRASVLWMTDGSESGTHPLRSWPPTSEGVAVQQLVASGSRLFLIVDAPDQHTGLWVSDGTADGTVLVREFNHTIDDAVALNWLAPFGDRVLMSASGDAHGTELWISDGTAAGTRLLGDLWPGADSSYPQAFVDLGDRCAFVACTDLGCEPWITDGTPAGTTMVADVAVGAASSSPTSFAELHGTLYFAASDGIRGYELWREGEAPTCLGDCRGDGRVTIDDLIQAVAIALGSRPVEDCSAVDGGGDGRVTIDELIAAVGVALVGC